MKFFCKELLPYSIIGIIVGTILFFFLFSGFAFATYPKMCHTSLNYPYGGCAFPCAGIGADLINELNIENDGSILMLGIWSIGNVNFEEGKWKMDCIENWNGVSGGYGNYQSLIDYCDDVISGFNLAFGAGNSGFKFFTCSEGNLLEGDIFALLPISGSTINSEGSSFTFGWSYIFDYDLMSVGFKNRLTGITSQYVYYDIDDIVDFSTTINLNAFNIDKNGDWYFQGFLSNTIAEVVDDVFFTGRYITETTGDLAYSDDYYLTFSIAGYETMFYMETFADWYSIHSTRYNNPTDMFISITGFFEPTFNKIGEFGKRIVGYFDINEAYNNGYQIGKSIPIFAYYLGQISYFIGGFPFIKWVFIALLLFIGVFIFRLIMKFIPFFGN